jgi:anaerobic selenocysteine-containing dehydrogenase
MSEEDAEALGVASGDVVRVSTRRGAAMVSVEVSDRMQRGHVSLPNGLGLGYPTDEGVVATGVAPNELTAAEDRDPFVGTPWHKNVPARIERVGAHPVAGA